MFSEQDFDHLQRLYKGFPETLRDGRNEGGNIKYNGNVGFMVKRPSGIVTKGRVITISYNDKGISPRSIEYMGEPIERNPMRAIERLSRGVRQAQVVLTEEQHRLLKIRAAVESTNISDLIRKRLWDIIDPAAAEDTRVMVEQR